MDFEIGNYTGKNNRISKELMKKYTPLILHRQTENILQETE